MISVALENIFMAVCGLSSPRRHTLCSVSDLLAAGFHHSCGQDERQDLTHHPAHAPRTHSHQPRHGGEGTVL